MNVLHENTQNKGRFYIEHEGQKAAEMTYVKTGDDKIIIDHTEVGDVLKGKGAGKLLVEAGVAFASTEGLKIIPLCPFAKAVFDKTPEFRDVL